MSDRKSVVVLPGYADHGLEAAALELARQAGAIRVVVRSALGNLATLEVVT